MSPTLHVYDAAGNRIAKGSITSMSCDITSNGFQQIAGYVVGAGGEQLTEVGADNTIWNHTNVYAGGKLIGTYDSQGLHFHIDDPLGTRRAQVSSSGVLEAVYQSLPFGDGYNAIPLAGSDDPTENHFTGKERDTESGNDYFGARYYSSGVGRWLSPDPVTMNPTPSNPQSWNKYSYAFNNPLGSVDPDGRWPFWIHDAIDESVFSGVLSSHQISVIEHESFLMDFGGHWGQQDPKLANEHGMAIPGQSTADAWAGIANWVDTAYGYSQSSSGDASLQYFADAAHTLQDLGSPEHVDASGNPIQMYLTKTGAVAHFFGEITPADSWSGIGTSIRNTIGLYALGHPNIAASQGGADAWANRAITNYVDQYYLTQVPDANDPQGLAHQSDQQEAARQCALNNPAACDH